MKKRKNLAVYILLFILILQGAEGCSNDNKGSADESDKSGHNISSLSVDTFIATPEDIEIHASYTGVSMPSVEILLSPKISGSIENIHIKKGGFAAKGEVIADLYRRELALSVKRASTVAEELKQTVKKIENITRPEELKLKEINVEKRKADLQKTENDFLRGKKLLKNNLISKEYYEELERNFLESEALLKSAAEELVLSKKGSREEDIELVRVSLNRAMIELEIAKEKLSHTYIKSPVAGIVDNIFKEEGEYVSYGEPLVKIIGIDSIKVKIFVSQQDITEIKKGMEADVGFDSMPDMIWKGKVLFTGKTTEDNTMTYPVEIVLDNQDRIIRPGMMAHVKITLSKLEKAIAVPSELLTSRKDKVGLFVVKDGLANFVTVAVNKRIGRRYIIESGIKPGDMVISSLASALTDGIRVSVH